MCLMLPSRQSMRLRPVHRIKHVVDSEGNVLGTATSVTDLVQTVDAPVLANTNEVETGAKIYGIYLHVEVLHAAGTGRPNIYMAVMKNPGNNINAVNPDAVGSNDNKRFVLHQEMIMMSGDAGNGLPRPLFNGVIKIPKGLSRFGPSDRLQLTMRCGDTGITADTCVQCHYKEFR